MKKLNTFVHVVEVNEDGSHGRSGMFGPSDRLPDWAVNAISNPDVWAEAEAKENPEPETVMEPPRGGPGSSAEAWAKFAKAVDLDVPDGASAKEIQALWDERN